MNPFGIFAAMISNVQVLKSCVLACCMAASMIFLAGCSFSKSSDNATGAGGPAPATKLASEAQLAQKPAILRTTQAPDTDLPRLLESVPSEVRRPIEQIRRIPNTASSRRYWLTPWQGPKGDFRFSCLYAISPGEQGIGTSCYSDRELAAGRAVSFAFMDGQLEFIGFNPDPHGRVTVRFKNRSEPVPIRDGVYIGSTQGLPLSIRVLSGGRSFEHRVPTELKNSSG